MAEIVNLRQARKARERGEKERVAADNRVKFGAPKTDRDRAYKDAERLRKILDQSKLD